MLRRYVMQYFVDIKLLFLGGPELCQGNFQSNYTFDDNSSPIINVTLCGIPRPVVQVIFIDEKLDVLNTTVNTYTHIYALQIPRLSQRTCGKELTVIATGHNGILTKKTKIFIGSCKYDRYIYLHVFFL